MLRGRIITSQIVRAMNSYSGAYQKGAGNVVLADFLEGHAELDFFQATRVGPRRVATTGHHVAEGGSPPVHPGGPTAHCTNGAQLQGHHTNQTKTNFSHSHRDETRAATTDNRLTTPPCLLPSQKSMPELHKLYVPLLETFAFAPLSLCNCQHWCLRFDV